ncbi:MAG: RES family NAD+ phosphorylase [Nitrospirae bacterium]|nr:RES family NAD+ phosphorylase [Nitrospirota bacterium]
MPVLFDRIRELDNDVFRNIVSLRKWIDPFDDLSDGDVNLNRIAAFAGNRVKSGISPETVQRDFFHSRAIGYPFEREPYLTSRFGNGLFGVWYGSLEMDTTIHETAFHMMMEELKVEGSNEPIVRERAVYLVHSRALLIDLVGKEIDFPGLVADDYGFTHNIAERLHVEGWPGLLSRSARCGGINLAVFTPSILGNPRSDCFLTYTFDPKTRSVAVERQPGELLLEVSFKGC